jgi:hypothetical protein
MLKLIIYRNFIISSDIYELPYSQPTPSIAMYRITNIDNQSTNKSRGFIHCNEGDLKSTIWKLLRQFG